MSGAQKVMVGCRVDPEIKSAIEATAESTGVTSSEIIHNAILQYLGHPVEKTPMSRIEAIETAIENLHREYQRIARLLNTK